MRRGRSLISLKPFLYIWQAACLIVRFLGRLWSIVLAVALIFVGMFLNFTVIGALLGVPLNIFAIVLVVCAILRGGARRFERLRF